MLRQQIFIKGVQGRSNSRGLDQNIRAVSVFFHHTAQTANLTLDAAQAIHQLFLVFFGSLGVFAAVALGRFDDRCFGNCSFVIFSHPAHLPHKKHPVIQPDCIPPGGICQYIILKCSPHKSLSNKHIL